MHTKIASNALAELYGLPSARTRYRRIRKAKEKALLRLDRKESELWKAKCSLGYEDLTPPVQRGWKRLFVLRTDVAENKHAAFFQEILQQINTVSYNQRKSFKVKKRRRGRYGYTVATQQLLEPEEGHFNRLKLSDEQRQLFRKVERYNRWGKCYRTCYVFNEPWRFVLKIQPNIITKTRIRSWQLERELKLIDNHFVNHNLRPMVTKLQRGFAYHWLEGEKPRYKYNPIKGKSLSEIAYEYNKELEETNEY